jgi:hypothetical protein
LHDGTKRSYWWVCYPLQPFPFTHPDWTSAERLLVYDNAAFRNATWHRDDGNRLVPHWAYAANAFVRTTDRHRIEWTPCVPALRVRQVLTDRLEVELRSGTPNFESYQVRLNSGPPNRVTGGRVRWPLDSGENKLTVRTRNLFGVLGPEVTATVWYEP